jgi:hypothetical protein
MHPYLSADIAAVHVADLVREAAATCCRALAVRHPVLDRLRATAQRATAALHRSTGAAAPSCCPA